jgi:hypothetical protein
VNFQMDSNHYLISAKYNLQQGHYDMNRFDTLWG